ncbi:MAG: translation initiation factor IF-2 [Methylocystis sp.]|nr:translation initiation factor IF-2 [Methylocystis sp.]MCA3583924.1 translation initiation factor IF-2 [Methylocystis sp.]MCA3592428.1 translation initiation factor IF-2 [Methylocystis sp.]
MSDTNNPGDKTLSVPAKGTLSLKPRPSDGGSGTVRQSFSHGRSKTVAVEVVKRRQQMPAGQQPSYSSSPSGAEAKGQPVTLKPALQQKPSGGMVLRTLSESEQNARNAVLMDAARLEEEARKSAEADARQRAARTEAEQRERDAAEARKREEDERRFREDELRRRGQEEAVRRLGEEPRPPRSADGPRFDAPRAYGERPPRLDGMRPPSGDRGPRPDGDRSPPRSGFGDRGPRPDGDRGPRPSGGFGDRPPRPAGASGFGDRGPRPQGSFGDRGPRPDGDRGPRPGGYGDRGPRPPGAGGGFGDRGPRPSGGFGDRGHRPSGPGGAGPARFGFGRGPSAPAEPLIQENRRSAPPSSGASRSRDATLDLEGLAKRGSRGGVVVKAERPAKGGDSRDRGRLTVTNAFATEEERTRSIASYRRRVQRMKGGQDEQKEKVFREVILPETITIQELANRMSERGVDIIRMLMKQGQMHKITDVIDADTAQLIAEEMGHTVKRVSDSDVEEGLFDVPDPEETLLPRAPVITIMGHVDHGKTSLLDAIRKTNVVSGEAGGITQHIGAYQVVSPLGATLTFIDTPGHAAFTAMRARGAKVTDIVVLVVAANDSVMPQTIEAINHAKAAKVPMIVAINKIDLPDAKPEKVKTDLLQYDVQVESMGGETIEVELSAKTGQNLDKLLEMIQLQSEVLDLKANPNRLAEGSVIEAKLDRGRGPVATVLVQRGTLVHGDIVVAGSEWGRVRALINDKGAHVEFAEPSVPVEILGFTAAPEAGDRVAVVETEARAREITEYRIRQKRDKAAARGAGAGRSLADMMSQIKVAGKKEFTLLVKGDVQGSVEAIAGALEKLGNEEVAARIIHSGVGGITESDVTLANTTGAVILGFNVRAHKEGREAAERAGVEIRYYNIIYDLVDDIKLAMSGLLAPTLRETMLGNARIQEVFSITKVGKVAGCIITDGKVERGAGVRLIRDNVVIHEGTLKTLKRFKDEVKEVQVGQECGMAFEKYEDMRAGDIIECYRVEEVKRSL